jgi:hypothetical protein
VPATAAMYVAALDRPDSSTPLVPSMRRGQRQPAVALPNYDDVAVLHTLPKGADCARLGLLTHTPKGGSCREPPFALLRCCPAGRALASPPGRSSCVLRQSLAVSYVSRY